MLNADEMHNLCEQVVQNIREQLFLLNRNENPNALRNYLKRIGMGSLMSTIPIYETYKSGKIVIIGQSLVNKNVVYGIAKSLGIEKDRLELHLEYDDAILYDFKKLQQNPSYRVVLVGPMPHSTAGKAYHSSAITEMEQGDGYPRVVRLMSGHDLKITKTSLKEAFQMLLEEDYI